MTPADAYRAAREGAAFINRSDRVRVEFTGAQALATLNGLLTNDVTKLTPGTGQYAAALTAKGKVIADLRVFALGGTLSAHPATPANTAASVHPGAPADPAAPAVSYLVDTGAAAAPGLIAMFKKYVNPRLTNVQDVSAEIGTVGVFGPASVATIARVCHVDALSLAALGPYAHLGGTFGGARCTVARVPDLGVPGFDLFVPAESVSALGGALNAAGAESLDDATADVMRIEAGRPLWGTDMDENTLAQEAALDTMDGISFDKGCYTGQETVARVHFRGHVNRTLRGLRCQTPPPSGARVGFGENLDTGTVRSVALSPRLGAIALAYVRREVENGAVVTVRWEGGETQATVTPLPFG